MAHNKALLEALPCVYRFVAACEDTIHFSFEFQQTI